ncbi:MAG: hypothetical protein R6U63_02265, partial [Longimicrobiales bacterium]
MAVLLAGAGCGDAPEPAVGPSDVGLELVERSAALPYSRSNAFAVTGPYGVCMLDSYGVRIVCGDRAWRETRVVAREGRGPGEIGPYGRLLEWPDGAVAFRDGFNARITFFGADLEYERSVPVRGAYPSMSSTVDTA